MNLEEAYESLGIEDIKGFIATREEDLQLDFKTVKPSFTRDDRKNLAKALSGFANSAGGLIVWGVDARRIDEVNVASELQPIADLNMLISNLNSATGELVSPSVDGVRHKPIPDGPGSRSGYAVTLVPASQSGPHMAKGREHRYYKRSGDRFYRLEHFDLEDMFGRRPHPDLKLLARLTTYTGGLTVILGLENIGLGLAKYPYLHIQLEPPYEISRYELDGNGKSGLPILAQDSSTGNSRKYGGTSEIVVYPGSELQVTTVKIRNIRQYFVENDKVPDLVVHASYCSEGITMKDEDYRLPGKCIREQYVP